MGCPHAPQYPSSSELADPRSIRVGGCVREPPGAVRVGLISAELSEFHSSVEKLGEWAWRIHTTTFTKTDLELEASFK